MANFVLGPVMVPSVAAEYAWLERRFGRGGFAVEMQSLHSDRTTGRWHDRLDIVLPDGRRGAAWFDITSFFAPAGQALAPSLPPAPPVASSWTTTSVVLSGLALAGLAGLWWFTRPEQLPPAELARREAEFARAQRAAHARDVAAARAYRARLA